MLFRSAGDVEGDHVVAETLLAWALDPVAVEEGRSTAGGRERLATDRVVDHPDRRRGHPAGQRAATAGRPVLQPVTAGGGPGFAGTPADLVDDLVFATAISERAGQILAERYERVERVDFKGAKDIVTEVDHLSEALILEAIRAQRPRDAILAEETGAHDGHHGAATSGRGRVWIVDPLDGTTNFAHGYPAFSVSLGLLRGQEPVTGVV